MALHFEFGSLEFICDLMLAIWCFSSQLYFLRSYKIQIRGEQIPDVLDLLDELGWTEHSLFVSRAGQNQQRVVTDLRSLRQESPEAGYLSIILTRGHGEES